MAQIRFSSLVSDIRGKIGGNVFSRNANGAFVREATQPINTNTEAQQAARNTFGAIARSWKELTSAEQKSFIDQAVNYPYVNSLGVSSIYTGFQLFQKVNSQLRLVGAPAITTMLAPIELVGLLTLSVNPSILSNLSYTFTFTNELSVVPANTVLVVEATRAMSAGVYRPKRQDFKQLTVLPAAAAAPGFLNAVYEAVYGNIQVGQFVYVRVFLVSLVTGQTSNPIEASFTTVL